MWPFFGFSPWLASGPRRRNYYKYMTAERLQGLLEQQTLRFTQPGLFNDPFEMPAIIAAEAERSLWTTYYLPKLMAQTTSIIQQATQNPMSPPPSAFQLPTTFQPVPPVSPLGWTAPMTTSEQNRAWAESQMTPDEVAEVADQRRIIDRVREIDETYGILSLTELRDNLLMWAHYADEHRGVVVEIDIADPEFIAPGGDDQLARPINYSQFRPHLSVESQVLLEHFFTKSPQWAYEREFRIVRRLEKAILLRPASAGCPPVMGFPCPHGCIRSITFGHRFPEAKQPLALALRKLLRPLEHITLRQARVDPREYTLRFEPIETTRLGEVADNLTPPLARPAVSAPDHLPRFGEIGDLAFPPARPAVSAESLAALFDQYKRMPGAEDQGTE